MAYERSAYNVLYVKSTRHGLTFELTACPGHVRTIDPPGDLSADRDGTLSLSAAVYDPREV